MAEHLKYTYYQSRSQNGRLWTESKSQKEMIEQALEHPAPSTLTFTQFDVYESIRIEQKPWHPVT